jgi:hypothetical protein
MNSSTEDLARLRAIAEEGRSAPLLGGWHLIVWGGAISSALLANWGVDARVLPWPSYTLAFLWFGLTGAAAALSALVGRRKQRAPGAFAIGNKVERTVWTWAGAFLGTTAVALFVRAALRDDPAAWNLFAIMSPVGFGAYAIAIGTAAVAANDRGGLPFAFLSLAFAALTTLLIGRLEQFPVSAAGVALVTIGCGVRHLLVERRAL